MSLAGCLEGGDGREVRYGTLMPLTGDLGDLGGPIADGAALPAAQLEDEVDFTFDVGEGDTQTDPEAGISEAEALVDDGYPAIVGAAASNVTLQVAPQVFVPNSVVGISPASTSPAITDMDDDGYYYRTAPSDALQGPVIAQVVAEDLGATTMSTLFLNDDYGQALEQALVTDFESEHGGEVLEQVSFEPEQASYSSQIGTALEPDPDALFIVGFPQSGIQMFRDYYDEYHDDWGKDIIVPDGLIDSDLPGEVGNDMNNVWGTAPAAGGPGAEFFADLYEEEYDSAPGVFNSHAYDAAAVIILANVAAGENDGTMIRDNVRTVANPNGTEMGPADLPEAIEMVQDGEEINYVGASSPVDFDDNGDMTAVSYDIMQYQDGAIEIIESIDFEN